MENYEPDPRIKVGDVRYGEELRPLFGRTLLPSVLDKAFKGEL